MATQPAMFPEIETVDFRRSPELASAAVTVLQAHGADTRLAVVKEAIDQGELNILYLANDKPFNPDTEDEDQPEIAGRCVKAPGLWRDITGFHFAIWARSFFWDRMDENGQHALAMHELLHIEVTRDKNGQARFATRKHDVEDFVDIARFYGPAALAGDGARYVRAATIREARDIVGPLQDAADAAGAPITITDLRSGKSATITPDARAAEGLICQGSNHVPGHSAGCPMAFSDEQAKRAAEELDQDGLI